MECRQFLLLLGKQAPFFVECTYDNADEDVDDENDMNQEQCYEIDPSICRLVR